MAMHYKEIPGNLNYKIPNPEIKGIAEGKLKVVDKLTPLNSKFNSGLGSGSVLRYLSCSKL